MFPTQIWIAAASGYPLNCLESVQLDLLLTYVFYVEKKEAQNQ